MLPIRCFQVDAFTSSPLAGSPAAVCLLSEERDANWMQALAADINLSETAFGRPLGDSIELRLFTIN
jgi:PhzF family phenazine biosynthesis protein